MPSLHEFIRAEQAAIMADWERRVTAFPSGRDLAPSVLRDSMPELLEELARAVEQNGANVDAPAAEHGRQRYRETDHDLRQVALEYRELRLAILELHGRACDAPHGEQMRLHKAIDDAVARAVDVFHGERERERELFVSALGNDLRGPLHAVSMGASVLLALDSLGEREADVAVRIANAARRMGRLVTDLLDFARLRIGEGIPVAPSKARLDDIARNVLDETELAHPTGRFTFETRGDLQGAWDTARIEQVIANLLDAALRDGDGSIDVTVSAEPKHDLRVEVVRRSDGGEVSGALPDPLQVSLGLTIAREIARGHGGDISVLRAPGRTSYILTLPRQARPGRRRASRG